MSDRVYYVLLYTAAGLFGLMAMSGYHITAGPLAERIWKAFADPHRTGNRPGNAHRAGNP